MTFEEAIANAVVRISDKKKAIILFATKDGRYSANVTDGVMLEDAAVLLLTLQGHLLRSLNMQPTQPEKETNE